MKLQERYQLFEIIGKGGNSVVYRALDILVDVNNSIRILYKDIGLIKLGKN